MNLAMLITCQQVYNKSEILNCFSFGSDAFRQNGPDIPAGKSFEWGVFQKVLISASNRRAVVFKMLFLPFERLFLNVKHAN